MHSLFANIKQDLRGAVLEFAGTFFFLSLAFGTAQATTSAGGVGQPSPNALNVFIISVSFGFSLLVSAWLFYRVTGGLFNPNVTLALFLVGAIGPVRFALFCVAQLAGSIAAAGVIVALSPGPCSFNTHLQQGINPAQGVFIEMFATSYLVLAVLMLAVEKHRATPFAPVGIGLALFVGQMWSIYYTGGAENTARAFGPAVITGFPYGTHWVYWVGPGLGSFLGTGFYAILKYWGYSDINPNQDVTGEKISSNDPAPTARRGYGNDQVHSADDHHGGTSGTQSGTTAGRRGKSQDDLV